MTSRIVRLLAGIALLLVAGAGSASAQELPRRAALGARMANGEGAPRVEAVLPGGTFEALKLKPGDTITAWNGVATPTLTTLLRELVRFEAGDRISLSGRRNDKPFRIAGRALGRPAERYDGATVTYGAVPFRGGLLRDIMVMPMAAVRPPVVMYIQGFTCASIDPGAGDSLMANLARDFAAAGIAFYRVEKPGVGDSRGGLDCKEIGFADELDSFRTAYRHLIDKLGYAPDRIFLLGHSMGGVQAPLLAAEIAPRGVAVFGTIVRNWLDYMEEVDLFQDFAMAGADPVREYADAERNRALLRGFYLEKKTPAELAAENPAYGATLKDLIGWDGGTLSWGRHYRFLQDVPDQRLIEAWSKTHSEVLSLYGESDMIAVFGTDQRMIADIVNYYRPGTARFLEIPGTMHGMDLVGDRETFRRRSIARDTRRAPYNPQVGHALVQWIEAVLARPPVRERRFPEALADRTARATAAPTQ